MGVENILKEKIGEYLSENYSLSKTHIEILRTRKEFNGDYTVVLFPLIPLIKKKPAEFGCDIGDFLKDDGNIVKDYNIVQGFLNLVLFDTFLVDSLKSFNVDLKNNLNLKNDFYLI